MLPTAFAELPPTQQLFAPPPPHSTTSVPVRSAPTAQINFLGAEGLVIHYDCQVPRTFDSAPLVLPATHDFGTGAIYRLKLSNIPDHPDRELFPLLEIAPFTSRSQAFLAHSSVPIEFTDADFDQVFTGNFVIKVVYLPEPEIQNTVGVATLTNTNLAPGIDPIVEASQRGSILAIVRLGNRDMSNRASPPDVVR